MYLVLRYVNRSEVKRPSSLDFDEPNSKAYIELKKNFLRDKKFECYKDDSIKDALNKLFHGKCAYCESIYTSTQPVDIEHFRPKGTTSGYWWLAAVWENLLPSCIDCNRRRYQKLHCYQSEVVNNKLSGKHDLFPVITQKAVAPPKGFKISNTSILATVSQEAPLLIDPTIDKIDDWFTYTKEGVISPSDKITNNPNLLKRVDETIKIIGLNRTSLVSSRKEVLLQLECLIFTIEKIAILIRDDELSEKHKEAMYDLLVYIFKHVKSFQKPNHPYSAMCKTVIGRRLKKIV
ncbi:retron system putative HNH endonuclease [Vibrio splendidus]|uniref:retron system putative HNH endonuclease n=1 Tax=Vibrio splendidus TaxID=29497 RepID=UPI000D3A60D6|nr:retron system putative HNH endonuclease [Vibrio splendidus]PTP68688.1 TIGR02646 family protein [Vibrio splendidus]